MSHPLTDEFLEKQCQWMFDEQDMRLAYDMGVQAGRDERLEQCVEWLARLDPKYALATHSTLARMMKDAMRSAAQEES